MKRKILSFKVNQLLKKRDHQRSMGYQKAQAVGIIINTEISWKTLNEFIEQLKKDHKEVHPIRFIKKEQAPTTGLDYYSPYDFNLFGQIKSECIKTFINRSYDYIFVLDREPTIYVDYLAAKANSKLNIGFYYESGNQLADLQIKPDHGRELDDLLRYSRQLS